ncbi:MAG: hypothetical protein IPL33_14755 [Sphingobacteriales bacterium]|nr:hypothetical protein [Sphingobacteriales bacterium]
MLRRISLLCASDWESSHNRRQRPHSRRMPSRGRFSRISHTPLDAGYGRLCIVGGGFCLDTQKFTCYEALNRFT